MKNKFLMKENLLNNLGMVSIKTAFLIFSFLALTLSASLISAVGVSTPYWSTNPLKLQPGESTIISLGLQNMVGEEDVTLKANISKGSEIAKIVDASSEYFVPFGTDNVTVNIEVTLPENAEVNKVYDIEVSFLQSGSGDSGGFFAVASAFTQRIPVLAVGEPTESAVYEPETKKQNNILVYIIIILVIFILAVLFAISREKRKK